MILSKFTKRERRLTVITVVIVLSTVSYVFIIEPLMRAWSELSNEIRTSEVKLEKSFRLLNQQDRLKAEYEMYAPHIKKISSDEEEIASMLKVVEEIARNDSIHITNIRPQPLVDRGFYKEIAFELIAEANIKQLCKFMYDLQSSGNLLRTKRLTLSAASSKKEELKAVMEIAKPSINPI